MTENDQIRKWRKAYANIEVSDEALATMAPFPSLFANDFAVYLESKGLSAEVLDFVRDLNREMVWAYDNWAKALRDAKAEKLLADLLNNANYGGEYQFTATFIRDYAKANNINLGPATEKKPKPDWLEDFEAINVASSRSHPAYSG